MKSNPLVTIYIPCRNYGKYLRQSIESVLSQIYSNWELFIIDEGSNDDTEEISKQYQSKHPEKIFFKAITMVCRRSFLNLYQD